MLSASIETGSKFFLNQDISLFLLDFSSSCCSHMEILRDGACVFAGSSMTSTIAWPGMSVVWNVFSCGTDRIMLESNVEFILLNSLCTRSSKHSDNRVNYVYGGFIQGLCSLQIAIDLLYLPITIQSKDHELFCSPLVSTNNCPVSEYHVQ